MVSFSKFSNQEIEFNLKGLVCKERKLLHVILEHIREVEIRKIYLERAYSTLSEYLVKEYGYSGTAANRRIDAARLLRDVPALSEKIQDGTVNLTQIGELSRAIKEKEKTDGLKVSNLQKTELVAAISGMTTMETQKELCSALDIQVLQYEKKRVQKDDSIRLEITFSKEQYQKLMQAKDTAAPLLHQTGNYGSIASLVDFLAEQYLKKNEKIQRQANDSVSIQKRANKSASENSLPKLKSPLDSEYVTQGLENPAASKDSNQIEESKVVTAPVELRSNKTLTPKTRQLVLKRDQCCQYVDPKTGKQCKSTYSLQTDHKVSRWAGGDHSLQNLQVLCFQHNQFKYFKESRIRKL